MDAKTGYSDGVAVSKRNSEANTKLREKIQGGETRKETYQGNWQRVDINDVVERFAPGSSPVQNKGKIEFWSMDRKYTVVADTGGGYLRIYDNTTNQYVGLNGEDLHNYTDERGKQHGRSKSDFRAVTHFKIKKRGEK
ncbi:MAG: hypothetical protein Q4F84_04355 [Fibrobacter sp.]|nr:hypothetical protein [Fibrobacter sp.]